MKEASLATLGGLQDSVEEALGVRVSKGEVIELALRELAQKYPPTTETTTTKARRN
jgi:hypothetical protein